MIVRWPSVTEAGAECDEPVMTIDFFPTLLEVAGVKPQATSPIDGRSLVPLLKDPSAEMDRNLYWHFPHYHAGGDGPYSAVRAQNYRLIEFHEDDSVRLYDLASDPGENNDLAGSMPDRAAELRSDLHRWRQSVKAQMPTENPDFDPQRATQVGKAAKR